MIRPGAGRSSIHTLLFLLAVATVGGITPPARLARAADEIEALARRHFTRGKQLYDERKYREAAAEFEAGYAVAPRAGFLLNIGHSYRRAGDLRKARRYYELFLEKDATSPQRGEVQGYIKGIDDTLADQREEQGHPAEAAGADGGHAGGEGKVPAAPPPPDEPSTAAGAAPSEPVAVCAERETRRPRQSAPVWPWLVSGAALVFAGAIVAAVLIAGSGNGEPCGTLGCLNER